MLSPCGVVVVLIMHISDCIVIITSLASVQSGLRGTHGPHARPHETLDHPDCDGSYLSWDGPTTAQPWPGWPGWGPMRAQCGEMSWSVLAAQFKLFVLYQNIHLLQQSPLIVLYLSPPFKYFCSFNQICLVAHSSWPTPTIADSHHKPELLLNFLRFVLSSAPLPRGSPRVWCYLSNNYS